MGVKEQATQKVPLFSRGVKVYRFGDGLPIFPQKELFFSLPVPLVYAHKIDFSRKQKFDGYIILAASTDTLFKKGVKFLGGDMGQRFWVIEFNFEYLPKDRTLWSQYDYDGKGYLRLERDTSILLEQWQMHLFDFREGPLVDLNDEEEMNNIFSGDGEYFKKLWDEGTIRAIVENLICKDPMATYQYGTVGERIKPGIEMILGEVEREIQEVKLGRLPAQEKKEKLAKLEERKSWLEKTEEKVYERIKHEYGTLRESPGEFKKYLSDPQMVGELRNFETIWWNIQSVILQQYATEKLVKIMKGELGEEKRVELLNELVEKIQKEKFFDARIGIKDTKVSIHQVSYMKLMSFTRKAGKAKKVI